MGLDLLLVEERASGLEEAGPPLWRDPVALAVLRADDFVVLVVVVVVVGLRFGPPGGHGLLRCATASFGGLPITGSQSRFSMSLRGKSPAKKNRLLATDLGSGSVIEQMEFWQMVTLVTSHANPMISVQRVDATVQGRQTGCLNNRGPPGTANHWKIPSMMSSLPGFPIASKTHLGIVWPFGNSHPLSGTTKIVTGPARSICRNMACTFIYRLPSSRSSSGLHLH